jgi:hypothetical protein
MRYRGKTYYVVSVNEAGVQPLKRCKGWVRAFKGARIEEAQ